MQKRSKGRLRNTISRYSMFCCCFAGAMQNSGRRRLGLGLEAMTLGLSLEIGLPFSFSPRGMVAASISHRNLAVAALVFPNTMLGRAGRGEGPGFGYEAILHTCMFLGCI